MKEDNNILFSVKTIGKFNLLAYISTPNPADVHQTILGLRHLFPEKIKNYEVLIAYEEHKYTYFPEALNQF